MIAVAGGSSGFGVSPSSNFERTLAWIALAWIFMQEGVILVRGSLDNIFESGDF